ncbi:MAG: hypothetical protein WBX10_21505 [Candidatus Sulfotelmatobacter sp.]
MKAVSTDRAWVEPGPGGVVSRRFLYRRLGSFVIVVLALWGMAVIPSGGQEERPQIVPRRNRPQENKKPKNGKEPRAVGIVQFSGSSKGTLIPVAILIDGKFYDASAYKADPIPMALESGTVYEAEQTGDPDGLFVVNGALHSQSAGSAHPWVGTGTYLPPGTEAPKDSRKAEDVPVGMGGSSDDEPPRLTRKGESKTAGTPDSKAPDSSAPAGSPTGQETPKTSNPPSGDKPTDASGKQQAPAAQGGSGQRSASQSAPGQSAPGQSGAGQTSSSQGSPAGQTSTASSKSQSSPDEADGSYYRPQLRRGKPTGSAPPDEDDKAIATKGSGTRESAASSGTASGAQVRMVAAISDAAGPDPQSYKFFWKTGEEEERRNQMLALAADEVRAYAAALAQNRIPARPVTSKAANGGHKAAKKPPQPVFENIQFHGFNLWLTDQPVMILSAEARIPVAPGTSAPAGEPYSLMLVARTDIYGDLRKLYSGVTDRFHLDVTPRLELIDVIDADGDGRGELLFRETADTGSGYLIYRATADKLWKMFDSLNAE